MTIGYSTITQKGQITIPAQMRTSLNLNKKKKVLFVRVNGHLEVRSVPDVLSLCGALKTFIPFDEKAMKQTLIKHIKARYDRTAGH